MSFSHAQSTVYANNGGGTTGSVSLANAPATGDLVCLAIWTAFGGTISGVQDGNGNVYTISPNSPENAQDGQDGTVILAYLASAPANAHKTVTATFSVAVSFDINMFIDDFTVTGGTAVFDTDGKDATNGPAITTPSITPATSGELFYAVGQAGVGTTGTGSPWTQNDHGLGTNSENAAYILSQSSATGPNFTLGSSSSYSSVIMAFKIVASSGIAVEDDSYRQFQPPPVDPIISVW